MNVNGVQVSDGAPQLGQGRTTEDLIGTLITWLHKARDICVGVLGQLNGAIRY